jgi:hypothetical protein
MGKNGLVVGGSMKQARSLWMQTALAFAFVLFFSRWAVGQQAAIVPPRITQPVDLERLVTLRGNTHPLARPEFDQGAAPDTQPMERILLVLQRSPEQEAALRKLLDEQQIKSSPNYHMWLTPEQFGQQFGPADADIQAVTDWLTSQGFQVSHVAAGRTIIEFSGTAGQVRQAFHTEMHKFVVNGEEHWANASDPQIPAALTPVVAGFASLNNFPKRPRFHRLGTFSKSKATGEVRPLVTIPATPSGYYLAFGPGDLATIYNVLPLWNASPAIDGTGQTIAVPEQSNINIQDVVEFRTMFGLPAQAPQTSSLCQPAQGQQVPVNLCLNGPDPGILYATGDESEADADVEWAGAVAKGATVDFVVSEETEVTAGVDLSALYIIDNNLAPIMSESYGLCEAFTGAAGIQFYNTLWEQGAAQGITIIIAAGDSGSAGCDDSIIETAAQYGLEVSGNATTPFNVAVGGTDFSVTNSNWQTYWNTTNSSPYQSSAKSYIPELTWNDSCAQSGQTPCSTSVASDGSDLVGGGGGPSNCAYPVTLPDGRIECTSSGGIYGIPKPSWQSGTGVPPDSVRDTPDVSLFSAGGSSSGVFLLYCEMDANPTSGGAGAAGGGSSSSCDLNSPYLDFQGAGGTSFAAPAFAGIIAMVNQKTNQRQGNANYVLYPMAATAATNGTYCASNASAVSNTSCIFYDTQTGNNSVACVAGSLNCSNTGTSGYGILEVDGLSAYTTSTSNFVAYTASTPAWPTSAGYDLATGLGTVNVANLVNNWTSVSFTPTTTTLSISPTTITHGQPATVTVSVSPASATGDVSLIGGPSGGTLGIGPFTLSNGAIPANTTTTMLPGGTYSVTAHYAGNGTYGASDSPAQQVTVNPENSKTLVQVVGFTCTGVTYGVTTVSYGYSVPCSSNGASILYSGYLLKVDVTNSSGSLNASDPGGVAGACYNSSTGLTTYQCPAGQVTVTNNGGAITDFGAPSNNTPGTYTLNSQGYTEDQYIQLPVGTNALVANYVPHPISTTTGQGLSYITSQGAATITVTQATTATTVSSNPTSLPSSGGSVTLTAVVNTSSVGLAPSGTVHFSNNGTAITGTVNYTPVIGSAPNEASLYGPGQAPAINNYASLTATLTTTITPPASITATYSGDTNYQGSTSAAVSITTSSGTADFSLTATPTSFTIASPGLSGTTTISAGALNNFTGTVNVTCALPSAMTYSTCSLVPASFSVPGSSTLTVNTTAPSTALPLFNRPRWFFPSAGAIFASILLLLIPRKKRRVKLAFGLLVFALLAAAFVACGGSSSSIVTTSTGTPTGSYTIVVTGTSGTLSHTLNVPVTVQ